MAFDPTEATAMWSSGMANSTEKWKKKIAQVRVNPAQKAVAAKEKMVARFQASMNDGSYEAAMQGVTLQSWIQSATSKASRLAQGAQEGRPKMQAYLQAAKPIYDQNEAEIEAMPNVTEEDSVQRMIRNMQNMKKLKGL